LLLLYVIRTSFKIKTVSLFNNQKLKQLIPCASARGGDGIKQVDVTVENHSDDGMLSIMIQENATQRGQNSAAILDSVAAAMKRISYIALSARELPTEFCRQLFDDDIGLDKVRTHLKSGIGVGLRTIQRLPGMNALASGQTELPTFTSPLPDFIT